MVRKHDLDTKIDIAALRASIEESAKAGKEPKLFLDEISGVFRAALSELGWDINPRNALTLAQSVSVQLYMNSQFSDVMSELDPDVNITEGYDEDFTEVNIMERAVGNLVRTISREDSEAVVSGFARRIDEYLIEEGAYNPFPR